MVFINHWVNGSHFAVQIDVAGSIDLALGSVGIECANGVKFEYKKSR